MNQPIKEIIIPAELHEARMIVEALHAYRDTDHEHVSNTEIDALLRRIMSHMGFPNSKILMPDIYAEYYPYGPPKIRPWW